MARHLSPEEREVIARMHSPRRCTSAATCQPKVSLFSMVATTVRSRGAFSRPPSLLGLLAFFFLRRMARPATGIAPLDRRPTATLHLRRQSCRRRRLQELRGRLGLRVHRMGLRLDRQATRHLRLTPTRLAHAPPRILGPRLHAASVQHHHGRPPRRLLVGPFQPTLVPMPAHDSGLERFATPFPCGSFIRYSMPVLTGAFPDPFARLSTFSRTARGAGGGRRPCAAPSR